MLGRVLSKTMAGNRAANESLRASLARTRPRIGACISMGGMLQAGAKPRRPVFSAYPMCRGIRVIEREHVSMQLRGQAFLVYCAILSLLVCARSADATTGVASGQAAVTITVSPFEQASDLALYLLGMNFASKVDGAPTALTLDRSGGNRWTAYNWETNASNAGSDYQYSRTTIIWAAAVRQGRVCPHSLQRTRKAAWRA